MDPRQKWRRTLGERELLTRPSRLLERVVLDFRGDTAAEILRNFSVAQISKRISHDSEGIYQPFTHWQYRGARAGNTVTFFECHP